MRFEKLNKRMDKNKEREKKATIKRDVDKLIKKIKNSVKKLGKGTSVFRSVDFVNFTDMFTYLNYEELLLLVLSFSVISGNDQNSNVDIGFYRSGAILRILMDLFKKKEEVRPIFYYKMVHQRLIEPKLSKISSDIVNIYDDSVKTGATLGSFINLLIRKTKSKRFKKINIYVMFRHKKYGFNTNKLYYAPVENIKFHDPLFYVDYKNMRNLEITLSAGAEKLLNHPISDKETKIKNFQNYINRFEKILSDKDSSEKREKLLKEKLERLKEVLKETIKGDFKKYYFALVFTDPIFVSLICWHFAKKIYNSIIDTGSKSIAILSTGFEGDILNVITAFFVKKMLQDKMSKDVKIFINKFPQKKHNCRSLPPVFFVDYSISTEYLIKLVYKNSAFRASFSKTDEDFEKDVKNILLVFNPKLLENKKIITFFS